MKWLFLLGLILGSNSQAINDTGIFEQTRQLCRVNYGAYSTFWLNEETQPCVEKAKACAFGFSCQDSKEQVCQFEIQDRFGTKSRCGFVSRAGCSSAASITETDCF